MGQRNVSVLTLLRLISLVLEHRGHFTVMLPELTVLPPVNLNQPFLHCFMFAQTRLVIVINSVTSVYPDFTHQSVLFFMLLSSYVSIFICRETTVIPLIFYRIFLSNLWSDLLSRPAVSGR